MARITDVHQYVVRAVREGVTPTELIRALRAAGMGARESEVRALYKTILQQASKSKGEIYEPLHEVPSFANAQPWVTVSKKGVSQAVEITYRQKSTGTQVTVPYRVNSETGVTRQQAIDQAIAAYRDKAEEYDQEFIGAVHTKTFRFTPTVVK